MNDGTKTSEPEAAAGPKAPQAATPEQPVASSPVPAEEAAKSNEPAAASPYDEYDPDYDYGADDSDSAEVSDEPISWTASEFIAHQKTPVWYLKLAGIIVVLAAIGYLFTRDVISASVVVICGIIFGIYAGHAPRQLTYIMDLGGLTIAGKFYPYELFRSFTILQEGAFGSINLAPLKRFSPGLTIYFDPADEHRIVELLESRLPLENRRHDPVDRLMRRIRF